MSSMRAALLQPSRKLIQTTIPKPSAEAGELVVKVKACGLCHTDLHYIDHGVATAQPLPLVLGHEAAGLVEQVGQRVEGWSEGDRVLIPAVFSCGNCSYCRHGRENLCQNLEMLGNHRNGAFAEYVAVPARDCLTLPEEISMESGCLIADALSTAYHAVDRAGTRPGDKVAVIGCGGMGINLVQCAALSGAEVVAVDRVEEKLQMARQFGAVETINAAELQEPIGKVLRRLSSGGLDFVFEAIGAGETLVEGLSALRKGGTLMTVGYCPDPVPVALSRVMFFELEIRGSLGCPAGKYPEIVQLARCGKLNLESLVSGVLPLEEIETGLQKLRRSEGFRWVITP